MTNVHKKYLLVFAVVALASFALPTMAQLVPDACRGANAGTQCSINDLAILVFRMINYLFAMAGFVSLGFVLWGGLQMLISRGNPDAIKNGRTTISNALLGLVIVFGSYLIVNIVANQLSGGTITSFSNLVTFWR